MEKINNTALRHVLLLTLKYNIKTAGKKMPRKITLEKTIFIPHLLYFQKAAYPISSILSNPVQSSISHFANA